MSSLTSTVFILRAAIYAKTKKLRQTANAGRIIACGVKSVRKSTSPIVFISAESIGLVAKIETITPIAEPTADTSVKRSANCSRSTRD